MILGDPVEAITSDQAKPRQVENGIALCLSGGGYRAMLYHVGALTRFNELGLLSQVSRVSSVSGGSITGGVLGAHWKNLAFGDDGVCNNFAANVTVPIRRIATITIDCWAVLWGTLLPWTPVADRVARAYAKHLFGNETLQDLPGDDEGPRFVINATNLQSGALWRFSKPYMADWRVGRVDQPRIPLATAVAASSACPPLVSPLKLHLQAGVCKPLPGNDLHRPPFTTDVVLADGGVYDNLGLETAWKRYRTIFVSNGGATLQPEGQPSSSWIFQSYRVMGVMDHQVRSLRERQLIASYQTNESDPSFRRGSYWGIRTPIESYGPPSDPEYPFNERSCPQQKVLALANLASRLEALSDLDQERLINWGYASTDASIRRYFDPSIPFPAGFPYPASGV